MSCLLHNGKMSFMKQWPVSFMLPRAQDLTDAPHEQAQQLAQHAHVGKIPEGIFFKVLRDPVYI
jgi:hypothetical protein